MSAPRDGETVPDYMARLMRERYAPQWQPIETAPRDGTRILGYDDSGLSDAGGIAIIRWSVEGQLWWDETLDLFTPTHWQPLPTPPQE